jgi:hypothetical protein
LAFTLFQLVSSTVDLLKTKEVDAKLTDFRKTIQPVIYALIKSHLSLEEHKALPRRIESVGTATREAYTNYSLVSGGYLSVSGGETEANGDMISYLLRGFPNGMRSFGALQPLSEGANDRHEIRHGNGLIQQLPDARFLSTAGNQDYAELEVSRVENIFTSAGRLCSAIDSLSQSVSVATLAPLVGMISAYTLQFFTVVISRSVFSLTYAPYRLFRYVREASRSFVTQ